MGKTMDESPTAPGVTIIESAITGSEPVADRQTPFAALQHFYRAFNTASIEQMAENWAQTTEVSMSNPLGGVRRGWRAIRPVYEKIFHGPAQVYVEFYDYSIHESEGMFCALGRERGEFVTGSERIALAIRTSRIYRKQGGVWLQLHHHGSIDDPGLLARYQRAVTGGK